MLLKAQGKEHFPDLSGDREGGAGGNMWTLIPLPADWKKGRLWRPKGTPIRWTPQPAGGPKDPQEPPPPPQTRVQLYYV